jgi:hypothetical protein
MENTVDSTVNDEIWISKKNPHIILALDVPVGCGKPWVHSN